MNNEQRATINKLMKKALPYLILILLLCWHAVLFAQDRFPRPEFETDYVYPEHQMPQQRAPGLGIY